MLLVSSVQHADSVLHILILFLWYVYTVEYCAVLFFQSCLTLCDSIDCSPPGISVHGILPARILECLVLLQGIFLTQGLNLCLLHILRWLGGSLPLAPVSLAWKPHSGILLRYKEQNNAICINMDTTRDDHTMLSQKERQIS